MYLKQKTKRMVASLTNTKNHFTTGNVTKLTLLVNDDDDDSNDDDDDDKMHFETIGVMEINRILFSICAATLIT